MGYCTSYELNVFKGATRIREILEEVESEFDGLNYAVDEDGYPLDYVKWYDHEADMLQLSKKYPDVVFKLKGRGEESGDIWVKYFKNGKMQECEAKITFDEFDENKLK